MSEDNYKETPTKDCPDCEGNGHFTDASECCGAHIDEDIKICMDCKEHSDFATCCRCDGAGVLDMTEEEINFEDECRRDDESDLMNDR